MPPTPTAHPRAEPSAATPGDAWIAYPRPSGSDRVRLFLFPFAGGSTATYRPWASTLAPWIEPALVRLPGREARFREAPHRRMEDLASALADAIVPHLDGPYAFFGHSMGAVVAFEVAQRLRDEGRPLPLHLFASGHRAPHIPYPRQPIHAVPNPRFREELALLGGTPQEILEHPELMGLLEPLLRADLELSETYRHGASSPLRCGITAFGGLADPHVPTGSIEAWRGHTQGPFRARFFPGDHFFLVPHARDLGVEIAADLQAVRPKAD